MCAGDKYAALNEKRPKVGLGVAGSPDYGGKLAAWISASHVEKAPKKKAPTP